MIDSIEIEKRISKSFDYDLQSNFVAAAIKYNFIKSYAEHAGLAICLDGELYIYHYTGAKIKLDKLDPEKWFIESKFDFIEEEEVESFYIHCETIMKDADPTYGFFYNGEYFDSEGKYCAENTRYQFMSCVGFCISVLTGAIENDNFILHDEWEMSDSDKDAYFQEHMESLLDTSGIKDRSYFKNNQRRIYPIEYFVSSFVPIPARKIDIDGLRPVVEGIINKKYKSN